LVALLRFSATAIETRQFLFRVTVTIRSAGQTLQKKQLINLLNKTEYFGEKTVVILYIKKNKFVKVEKVSTV
jgi:hypothetical protein